MATNTLCQVSAEYEAYALQTSLMKGELDWRSGMKDAKREGHKEVLELLEQGLSVDEIKERFRNS